MLLCRGVAHFLPNHTPNLRQDVTPLDFPKEHFRNISNLPPHPNITKQMIYSQNNLLSIHHATSKNIVLRKNLGTTQQTSQQTFYLGILYIYVLFIYFCGISFISIQYIYIYIIHYYNYSHIIHIYPPKPKQNISHLPPLRLPRRSPRRARPRCPWPHRVELPVDWFKTDISKTT